MTLNLLILIKNHLVIWGDFDFYIKQNVIANANIPMLKLNGWVSSNNTWYYYLNGVKVKNGWANDSTGWCFIAAKGYWNWSVPYRATNPIEDVAVLIKKA